MLVYLPWRGTSHAEAPSESTATVEPKATLEKTRRQSVLPHRLNPFGNASSPWSSSTFLSNPYPSSLIIKSRSKHDLDFITLVWIPTLVLLQMFHQIVFQGRIALSNLKIQPLGLLPLFCQVEIHGLLLLYDRDLHALFLTQNPSSWSSLTVFSNRNPWSPLPLHDLDSFPVLAGIQVLGLLPLFCQVVIQGRFLLYDRGLHLLIITQDSISCSSLTFLSNRNPWSPPPMHDLHFRYSSL
uniref:Uncharacterized protein n=1 Tax=Panagrolaimus sp. ES5 TaxID=591445 RepID=A0AC34GSS1_9BILA